MKRSFWKLCILLIALTMLLTAGAFAEGMIGLTALGLYGLSTLCGIQWACLRLRQEDEAALRAAEARRAARQARRRAAPAYEEKLCSQAQKPAHQPGAAA